MTKLTSILVATTAASAMLAGAAWAADTCTAYPTAATEKVESADLTKTFGAVPAPTKPLHVVYVTKTLINEFWQDVAAGVKDEAAKYEGITVDVQAAKDESSLIEQLNLAQTVLSQKPDILLLSPQSDTNLAPVIAAAKEANIPTIIIDDARTDGATSYIGTDQVAIGAKAADYFNTRFPDGGKVAQIEGAAGSPNARKRIQGFEDQLKTYPKLQLVSSQPGNWDRMTAMNATSTILRDAPDLVGVYANNDGMALGVVEAVRAANAMAQVAVVGTDGIRDAKRSVGAKEMAATVAEFPFAEGQLGVEVGLRILGCQLIPAWVVSPQAVITADNVAQYPDPAVK